VAETKIEALESFSQSDLQATIHHCKTATERLKKFEHEIRIKRQQLLISWSVRKEKNIFIPEDD
jgi:hypothetical protein